MITENEIKSAIAHFNVDCGFLRPFILEWRGGYMNVYSLSANTAGRTCYSEDEFEKSIEDYFKIKTMIEEWNSEGLSKQVRRWLYIEQKTLKKAKDKEAQYSAIAGDAKITIKCEPSVEVEFDFDGLNYPISPKNLDEVKTCVEFFKLLQ